MPDRKWAEEDLRRVIPESRSWNDVVRRLGGKADFRTARRWAVRLGLDTRHFVGGRKLTDEQIFRTGAVVNDSTLSKHLRKHKTYQCEICGNPGSHVGRALRLQVDHVNGKQGDNRLENLRWLCPNCHSQTATYAVGHRGLWLAHAREIADRSWPDIQATGDPLHLLKMLFEMATGLGKFEGTEAALQETIWNVLRPRLKKLPQEFGTPHGTISKRNLVTLLEGFPEVIIAASRGKLNIGK